MADTHGFQLVSEVTAAFLKAVMLAAWDSGGDVPAGGALKAGTIPHSFPLPAGTNFGSFVLIDGEIQIPRDQLGISFAPLQQSVDIAIGASGHAELMNTQNPLIPSLKLQNLAVSIHIIAPVGPLVGPTHGPHDVGIQLDQAPLPGVALTGPDPQARLNEFITDLVRNLTTTAPALPEMTQIPVIYKGLQAYTVTELLEVVTDVTHQVEVQTLVTIPPQLQIKIPVHFSLYQVNPDQTLDPAPPLLEGFVVEAQIVAVANLEDDPTTPGGFIIRLNAPTTSLSVTGIVPATPGAGTRYAGDQARLGPEFDAIVADHIKRRGADYLKQLGNLTLSVPTVASIQNGLAAYIKTQLQALGSIAIWPPNTGAGVPLNIADVIAKVLPDVLALAVNAGSGADANALTSFMPASRDLAFALAAAGVSNAFDKYKAENNIFKRYSGDPHDYELKSLQLSLRSGAIHFDGDMTIINAIPPCIDVDASFGVDVHLNLKIVDDPTTHKSTNIIEAKPDTPDVNVSLSILTWVITLILGLFTGGVVGVVIAAVVDKLAEAIVANMGTSIVAGADFTAFTAWPTELTSIGEVHAVFDNPIDISPDGILFSGFMKP